MSSNQALVRLPLDQARRDRALGLKTAAYISGYRGSPLGVYDSALWGAQKLLDAHDIRFVPGLNEELAVSAIRGTQQLEWFGKSEFEGVYGLWYGKGIGVDRRSEEHTSELQSLMRISYAVFCLKKKKNDKSYTSTALPYT